MINTLDPPHPPVGHVVPPTTSHTTVFTGRTP